MKKEKLGKGAFATVYKGFSFFSFFFFFPSFLLSFLPSHSPTKIITIQVNTKQVVLFWLLKKLKILMMMKI